MTISNVFWTIIGVWVSQDIISTFVRCAITLRRTGNHRSHIPDSVYRQAEADVRDKA